MFVSRGLPTCKMLIRNFFVLLNLFPSQVMQYYSVLRIVIQYTHLDSVITGEICFMYIVLVTNIQFSLSLLWM